MKRLLRIIIMAVMLVSLVGCQDRLTVVSADMEKRFQTAINTTDINQSIQLEAREDESIFQSGSKIRLIIKNASSKPVYFPIGSHVKLFIIENADWIEIKNEMTYSGMLVLSPQGTPLLDDAYMTVLPQLDDKVQSTEKEVLLRIVVMGELMENQVRIGESVGAYIDVYIIP